MHAPRRRLPRPVTRAPLVRFGRGLVVHSCRWLAISNLQLWSSACLPFGVNPGALALLLLGGDAGCQGERAVRCQGEAPEDDRE